MEKAPQPHWRGDQPQFQEIEILWIVEDASRYAALQAGEIHIADLPLDLQKDAASQGFKLIRSQFNANNMFVFFGGLCSAITPRIRQISTLPCPGLTLRFAGP
jgi:ABC-type transport system substrate-binding protein